MVIEIEHAQRAARIADLIALNYRWDSLSTLVHAVNP
jgi:hypothetical protein